jgi:4-hydroxyproline epimerase
MNSEERISYLDSHTGGEPTRVVIAGGPDLGAGSLAERAKLFAQQHDSFRSAVILEPRGSDVLVGAYLQPPVNPRAACGVIFFNNAGVLGMCGHGTIGLIETLFYLKRIAPGEHLIETPVGDVWATLEANHRVTVRNVPSYRYQSDVRFEVPGIGPIVGDIAWGGNWFFLVSQHSEKLELSNLPRLREVTTKIRQAMQQQAIFGPKGEVIDHIELFGPAKEPSNQSRNFVLCPGMEYDRSPCGTGTSAKLACLAAAGKLKPGEIWRQESIIGSVFEGHYQLLEAGEIVPSIAGRAWITSEGSLIRQLDDPFRDGIRNTAPES